MYFCLILFLFYSNVFRQVMGIILVLIGEALKTEIVVENSACLVQQVSNSSSFQCSLSLNSSESGAEVPQDFTHTLLLYLVVGTISLLVMVFLFRPKYLRLEVEQRAERILTQLRHPHHNPLFLSSPSSTSSFPNSCSLKSTSPLRDTPALKVKPEQPHSSTEF